MTQAGKRNPTGMRSRPPPAKITLYPSGSQQPYGTYNYTRITTLIFSLRPARFIGGSANEGLVLDLTCHQ